MASENRILTWLLNGDVAIQYQVYRDLLGQDRPEIRKRIEEEGWGNRFLAARNSNGHWGRGFYQPKWTSSHYTLLDLRNLGIDPWHPLIRESIQIIAKQEKSSDGGINPAKTVSKSDVCVNGMFLNYASYFKTNERLLESVVDFILSQKMKDGGFNCQSNQSGAVHSSLHTTLSIGEGIREYKNNGYSYRLEALLDAEKTSQEFILLHQFFISDRTGKIIKKDFLRFPYPPRWRYDILRALDYFQYADIPWDARMQKAIEVLLKKRNPDLTWNLNANYPGEVHFKMEKPGAPSRWNTLRAWRVFKHFEVDEPHMTKLFGKEKQGKMNTEF